LRGGKMVAVIATLICVVPALWYMKRNKDDDNK